MNLQYLLLIAVTLALGLGAQAYIKMTFKKWARVPVSTQLTGAEAARRMLDAHGLSHVPVQKVPGSLTDHFDPKKNTVSLSEDVYDNRTVSATAVACHECGHAVQHAQRYAPMVVRSTIVPVVSVASNLWVFVLLAGVFLMSRIATQALGFNLIWVAVALYAAVIVFQLITLPVEFNASSRALQYLKSSGYLPPNEQGGAASVLRSAALTYVAAALSSLLYLIYILGLARR
ncbi:MAG: zinc metallopeptidase [Coriobacteriales bacterium]|jgi:Zn-dependent membrane protease YugP|nr:zinc metallopeptidase [Coriobacteriales bacterium]